MALKNSQYDMIMRMYEQKRLYSRDRQNRRQEEVALKIPQIKEIDNTISSLSVERARKLLNGDASALSSLKEDINRLSKQKNRLLTENGFPADYLEATFECPDCRDTGYANNQKCHCFKKATIELLYTQSNLKEILKTENFNTFSLDYYSNNYIDPVTKRSSLDIMQNALNVCHEFVDSFGDDFRNLFFYGDPGVGKTFLSNCIAKELLEGAFSVIYFTAFELFDIIAKSNFDKDDTAEVMYGHIFDCDLLIIDDLGTELSNSFTTSQIFLCLNERILRRKPTIISTNLALDDFKNLYTERTFSRISSHYTMLRLVGDDIRIKKKLMNRR